MHARTNIRAHTFTYAHTHAYTYTHIRINARTRKINKKKCDTCIDFLPYINALGITRSGERPSFWPWIIPRG